MRKYWKTALMEASAQVDAGLPLTLGAYGLRFLEVAILLALWRMILADKGVVSGMTLGSVLTYTLIAAVFEDQFEVRTRVQDALWQGTAAMHFLRPMGLFGQFASQTFGAWGLGLLLCSVPLLLISPLLGVSPFPASWEAGLWFVPSLALAISAGLAIDFILTAVMVTFEQNIYVFIMIRNGLTTILSGAVVPLALLPWGLGHIFDWLPFAATASAPLRVYCGTGDPALLIAMQIGWNLVLWPLAFRQWRVSRERLVSHGG